MKSAFNFLKCKRFIPFIYILYFIIESAGCNAICIIYKKSYIIIVIVFIFIVTDLNSRRFSIYIKGHLSCEWASRFFLHFNLQGIITDIQSFYTEFSIIHFREKFSSVNKDSDLIFIPKDLIYISCHIDIFTVYVWWFIKKYIEKWILNQFR